MKKRFVFIAAMAAAMSAGSAIAATQGELDATSEGSFNINYIVDAEVQVWGFEDMLFTESEGSKNHEKTINLCAVSSTNSVSFSVYSDKDFYIKGDNQGGPFNVRISELSEDGGTDYDMWGFGGVSSGTIGMYEYVTEPQLDAGHDNSECSAEYQVAKLTVTINGSGLEMGRYSDIVTVMAYPN